MAAKSEVSRTWRCCGEKRSSALSDWREAEDFPGKLLNRVLFCALDGRSAAGESQRDRGPSGEHPPAEPRAATADADNRQLHSPGISGVHTCVCVWVPRCVSHSLNKETNGTCCLWCVSCVGDDRELCALERRHWRMAAGELSLCHLCSLSFSFHVQ